MRLYKWSKRSPSAENSLQTDFYQRLPYIGNAEQSIGPGRRSQFIYRDSTFFAQYHGSPETVAININDT